MMTKTNTKGEAHAARLFKSAFGKKAKPLSLLMAAVFSTVPYFAMGQSTSEEDEEIFELSPFEVSPESDVGFAAVNAGTATKLGVQMKDLAAPYSVMTGEFIDAVGITNLQEAVNWSTNGAPVLDGAGADLFLAPSMYNIRGQILNQGQQRNFFLTTSVSDSYAIERIDFGRGPNAVLFNVGANSVLGGGISTQTKQARVGQDFGEVALTVGSWSKFRATFDLNETITDKFAVRVNGMKEDSRGYLEDDMDKSYGLTLAATYKFSDKTKLRFEIVDDHVRRSRAPGPYFDNLSGWDGATTFDGPISNADYANWEHSGSPQGVWRQNSDSFVFIPGQGAVMNFIHTASTRRGDENSWVPLYSAGQMWSREGNDQLLPFGNWGGGQRPPIPGYFDNKSEVTLLDSVNLPADRFDRQIANSNFELPSRTFTLAPNDRPLFEQDTSGYQLGFSHDFSDNLFFELSADYNRVIDNPLWSINWRSAFIDINEKLPDGSDNPHYLDPYGEGNLTRRQQVATNWGVRANLAYKLDSDKLGKYTFNLTLSKSERDIQKRGYNYSMALADDPREWNSQRVRMRYYWTDENRPWIDDVPTTMFNRVVNEDGSYTTTTTTIDPSWAIDWFRVEKDEFDSAIFAFAGEWFEEKLVGTFGFRYDRQTASKLDALPRAAWPEDPNWDGYTLSRAYYRPDAPADWKDLTYYPKDEDGNPTSSVPIPAVSRPTLGGVNGVNPFNPLYAGDRFRNDYNYPDMTSDGLGTQFGLMYHATDWLSLHANHGTSYQPRGVNSWLLDYSQADPEEGVATDLGVTLSLFEQRLAVKVGTYKNIRQQALGGPPTTSPMNRLFDRQAWNDEAEDGRNNLGISGVFGSDYYKQKNGGVEIEVVGAITPNWRVTANYGTGRIDTTDRWSLAQDYVDSRASEMLAVLEAAGGMLDTSRKPDGAPSAPGMAVVNPDIAHVKGDTYQQAAATDYNNVWVAYDLIPQLDDTIGIKRTKINFFTDYSLNDGRFKGLRLGLGAQWTDQNLAGYRSADTLANPDFDASQPVTESNRPWMDDPSVDANTPVWVDQPFEVTGTIGYGKDFEGEGFFGGKRLELQLRIRNLLNSDDVIYQDEGVALRPVNGDFSLPNRVAVPSRIAQFTKPINFELTGRLKF